MTAQPWSAESGEAAWLALPPVDQQQLLITNDPLLLAAQGLKALPNGRAQQLDSKWKPIIKGVTYMPQGPQEVLEQIAELYRDPKEHKSWVDKSDRFDFLTKRDQQVREALKQAGLNADPPEPANDDGFDNDEFEF